jgi:hypothetical protein
VSPTAAPLGRREETPSRGPVSEPAWSWPIDLTRYDRTPTLSPAEVDALTTLGHSVRWWCRSRQQGSAWRALDRLVSPLAAVRATWRLGAHFYVTPPDPYRRVRGEIDAARVLPARYLFYLSALFHASREIGELRDATSSASPVGSTWRRRWRNAVSSWSTSRPVVSAS